MKIIKASEENLDSIVKLALMLWSNHSVDEFTAEFKEILKDKNAAIFLAEEKGDFIGFAQCQLRFDYVEGTESSPVGYLEGIYVIENHRGMGLGRKLVSECEKWSKTRGCTEFASDVEITNTSSYDFHIKLGFNEENRIICFAKKI